MKAVLWEMIVVTAVAVVLVVAAGAIHLASTNIPDNITKRQHKPVN